MRKNHRLRLSREEDPRCYVLVGFEDTWKASLKHSMWGFSERSKGFWNTSALGDYLAFYVGKPIQRIIGFGRITGKMVGDTIIWSDEEFLKRPFFRYRLQFEKFLVVEDWREGIEVSDDLILRSGRALISRSKFLSIVKQAERKWNKEIDVEQLDVKSHG